MGVIESVVMTQGPAKSDQTAALKLPVVFFKDQGLVGLICCQWGRVR
jgi:hypothetical protein